MPSQHSLRPDLNDCTLEARTLPAGYVWVVAPFFQINNLTNAFVVNGFSGANVRGSVIVNSVPNAYYQQLGINANIYGLVGQSAVVIPTGYLLGTSLWVPPGAASLGGLSITVGSGADEASSGAGPSRSGGYGASFNSGYSTSLSSLNSFGMLGSPLGSSNLSAYASSSSSGEATDSAASVENTTPPPMPSASPGQGPAAGVGPTSGTQGPGAGGFATPFGAGPGMPGIDRLAPGPAAR